VITDEDGFDSNKVRYQWSISDRDKSGFENILTGGNTISFTLKAAHVNKYLRVQAKYTDKGAYNEILTFTTNKIANLNDPISIETISGTLTEDKTLSISFTDKDGYNPNTVEYQWLQSTDNDAYSPITNATSSTLKLTQSLVDRYIKVRVSYTDNFGTKESATSAATSSKIENVDNPGIANLNTNIIHKEGATLIATFSDKDDVKDTKYQWTISSKKDSGFINITNNAESNKFVLTQAEVGKYVKCEIQYTDVTSEADKTIFTPVSTKIINVNQPGTITDITGIGTDEKILEDENLTAGTKVTDPDNVTTENTEGNITMTDVTYQWQSSSSNNSGFKDIKDNANENIFTLTQNEVDKYVRVIAIYQDKYGVVERVASNPTTMTITNRNQQGTVTFNGTISEANELTANVVDPDGYDAGSVTYQWQIDENSSGAFKTNIINGTNKKYTLEADTVGKYIRVVATYKDIYGFEENISSNSSAAKVSHKNSPGSIVIDGKFAEDENLTIKITDDDGYDESNVTYTWLKTTEETDDISKYETITEVNGSVFTLTQSYVGYYIKARVSYIDKNVTKEDLVSAYNLKKVNNVEDEGTIDLNDTNAIQYGTLNASSAVDEDGIDGTVLYQWIRGKDTIISGATNLSYKLIQADVNHTVKIRAVYKDDISNESKTIYSKNSKTIENVDDNGTISIVGELQENATITAGTINDLDGVNNSKAIIYTWVIVDSNGSNSF
jgi:hypothetical protein